MDKDKLKRILNGLLERTKNNSLNWQTTARTEAFLASLGENAVSIQSISTVAIIIELRDDNGDIFETEIIRGGSENWRIAQELFSLARDKSLNISEKVDQILKQLEGELAI